MNYINILKKILYNLYVLNQIFITNNISFIITFLAVRQENNLILYFYAKDCSLQRVFHLKKTLQFNFS